MQTQKEITRDSLHSSLKNKPKEVQDRFLEVVNENIRKGNNTSFSINAGNKAVIELEKILQEQATEEKLKIEKSNKEKLLEISKSVVQKINTPPAITVVHPDVDPEEIKSIYFNKDSKLVIEFGDGYKLISTNSAITENIVQHIQVTGQSNYFDYIQLNKDLLDTSVLPHQEGLLFYDKASHSLAYYNEEEHVMVNVGQENILRVYNNTASTLSDGSVVYISGAYQGWPTADLASCSSKVQAYAVIGVVTADIESGSFGYVCINGKVNAINTSAFAAGDTLYMSATPGVLTNIPPLQPNYVVAVGQVLTSDISQGNILVKVDRRDWFPNLQLLSPAASITLPTTPTVFKPTDIVANDGFLYSASTGEITFTESSTYSFTFQFNAVPSASNKNIYFYVEEWNGASWNIGRYTARQIRLVNNTEDQVQITAARYFKTGSKLRCYIWADATVELRSTDLPGTTAGTVTLPAFRLNIA